jgi:hypothetical protein
MNQKKSWTPARPSYIAAMACFILYGCAAEVARDTVAFTSLASRSDTERRLVKRNELVTLNSGYERTILKASQWKLVGSVPQGRVYASVASNFSVEGAHVHEAYLVVNKGNLVGFYLPVEKSFTPFDSVRLVNLWEEQ